MLRTLHYYRVAIASLAACLTGPQPVCAAVLGFSDQKANLTNAAEAKLKTIWSDPERIQVQQNGLGWGDSAREGSRDFWIQTTEPIALGESWRPPISANVRVTVEHTGTRGALYVRYSPDAKHWSSWHVLASAVARPEDPEGQHFEGEIRVPYREQQQYSELLQEYSRREDVAWVSDEEAFVKDLVARDPQFFRRRIPFVGYVQVLYETQLHGGERISGLKADAAWGIGGIHAAPKDPKVYENRSGPWRFKSE